MRRYTNVYTSSGLHLTLYADVAKALAIREGKRLTEDETWEAIGANARHQIRLCEAAIRASGKQEE